MIYRELRVADSSVQIRDFEERDIEPMIWFLRESDRQELADFGVDLSTIPDAETLRKLLRTRISSDRRDFLVIAQEGQMIGYISVPEFREGEAAVHAHIIYKDKRRQGVGRAALPWALSILFDNIHAEKLILEPKTTNVGMNTLIQSFGLKPVKTYVTQASAFTGAIEVNRYEVTQQDLDTLLNRIA